MDNRTGPLIELLDHPVEIGMACGCQVYRVARVSWVLERLGPSATIEEAERRLRCRKCKERPRLELGLQWQVSGGRDQRVDPAPLPVWARGIE